MYVIYETEADGTNSRVVMVTDDITDAVNHFADVQAPGSPGWLYVTEALGARLFHHTDGRTASLVVQADDRSDVA